MTDIDAVFDIVSNKLYNAGIDCILIGGFAVNYYGYTRNTLDVDFMIFMKQLSIVREIMIKEGFTNIIIEDNVAFFVNPDSAMRVDFLVVDKDTMQKLNNNIISASIHGYELRIPALKDLISMKIFSLSQNITRRISKDLYDISYLSILNNLDLDSDIKPLCDRFGSEEVFGLIKDQIKVLGGNNV